MEPRFSLWHAYMIHHALISCYIELSCFEHVIRYRLNLVTMIIVAISMSSNIEISIHCLANAHDFLAILVLKM